MTCISLICLDSPVSLRFIQPDVYSDLVSILGHMDLTCLDCGYVSRQKTLKGACLVFSRKVWALVGFLRYMGLFLMVIVDESGVFSLSPP